MKNIPLVMGIIIIIAVALLLIGDIPSDFNGIWNANEVNPDTGSLGLCKPREYQTGFFQCCFNYDGQQVDCRDANKLLGVSPLAIYKGTPGVGTAIHGFSVKNTGNVDLTASLDSFTWTSDELLSGLISWWTMEGILGDTSIDSVGDNHGTIYGAEQVEGYIGKALEFDGIDDYVDYGNDNSLQPKKALSLGLWIKPSEGQEFCYNGTWGNNGIAGSVDGAVSTSTWSWQLRYGSSTDCSLGLQLNTVDYGSQWVTVGYNLSTTEWTHIVVTFNGSVMKLYVNGFLNDINNFGETSIKVNTNNKLIIGSAGWGSSNTFYNGAVDEFKIYNRELSESEIKALYQGTQVPTDVTFLSDKWNALVNKPKAVAQGQQQSWATDLINMQVGCPLTLTTYSITANAKATTTIEGVSHDDFKTLKASFDCQKETISLDFDIIF